ncbi:hypothetical protein CYY_002115 [Polysphondylium violaceum]|uniref:PPIase cyclophilin-type domain-containing protein n=1 Tax=Polysphondylium violaceum TaxID=133409 RepID=A0A8J4Q0L6_9MYCE|nr:hypothetical protein CYY_002115 [Polysphondylium violaceum]
MSILIETEFGEIGIELFVDHYPALCNHFLQLCDTPNEQGTIFYKAHYHKYVNKGIFTYISHVEKPYLFPKGFRYSCHVVRNVIAIHILGFDFYFIKKDNNYYISHPQNVDFGFVLMGNEVIDRMSAHVFKEEEKTEAVSYFPSISTTVVE